MRGLWDEVRETTLALHVGQLDAGGAQAKMDEATTRLAALRARNNRGQYTDEIQEIETAMQELEAEIGARAPGICIFHRPGRNDVEVAVPGMPGAPRARGRLPDIQVVRVGQVDFIELDGRLRVRDWWELRIEGRSLPTPIEGPKRWIMKNAQGAAVLDAIGKPPAHLLLTGLAKRRTLYKLRRDRRRLEADRKLFRRAKARAREREILGHMSTIRLAGSAALLAR